MNLDTKFAEFLRIHIATRAGAQEYDVLEATASPRNVGRQRRVVDDDDLSTIEQSGNLLRLNIRIEIDPRAGIAGLSLPLENIRQRWVGVDKNSAHENLLEKTSGSNAGERQHRVHQYVGAGRAIGLGGILDLVVADAVLAGHEHHGGRNFGVQVAGIMAGTGGDAAIREAELLRRGFDRIDQFWIEMGGRLAPDQIERDIDLARCGNFRDRLPQLLVQ